MAFSPDGRELWVSLLGGHGVEVFDTRTMRRRKAIRLGKHGAVEVLFTRDGRTVYASQMETASVWEIDRHSFRVRRQLPTTRRRRATFEPVGAEEAKVAIDLGWRDRPAGGAARGPYGAVIGALRRARREQQEREQVSNDQPRVHE